MQVQYSDKIRQNSELFTLAEQASRTLEQVAPPSGSAATAEWDVANGEPENPRITLRLSDKHDAVTMQFTPNELQWAVQGQLRFYSYWGELLDARLTRQVKHLLEPPSTEGN